MFFSHKEQGRLNLILNVESCLVRASLVILHSKELPKIIWSHSQNINTQAGMNDGALIQATVNGVRDSLKAVSHFLHSKDNFKIYPDVSRKIKTIHYVLSSPWIVSEARSFSKIFEHETQITEKTVSDLLEEETKRFANSSNGPLRVIEKKVFDIRLNGYSLREWQNKRTKRLDISLTVSLAGAAMIGYFIETVNHFIRCHDIRFHSSLLLQYVAIEEVLEPGQNYCLLHVHGDETDISVIKQKNCIFFGTESSGVRTILAEITKKTNSGKETADSLVVLYTGEKLDDTHSARQVNIIEDISREWYERVKAVLSQQKIELKYPLSLIVIALSHNDFFMKILKKLNPGITVYALSIDDLLDKVVFANTVEKGRLISLHAIAIHSLESQSMLK